MSNRMTRAMVSRSVSRSLGHLDKVVLVLVQAQQVPASRCGKHSFCRMRGREYDLLYVPLVAIDRALPPTVGVCLTATWPSNRVGQSALCLNGLNRQSSSIS